MKLWFYIENSEQKGPVTRAQLAGLLQSGKLPPDALVWTHDLQDWTRASEVENLLTPLAAALPPSPPPGEPYQPAYTAPARQDAMFFHIPAARLVLMAIASWGLFEMYWIYRNWKYLKERDGLNIRPIWRAVFGIVFIHKLMKAIHDDRQANAIKNAEFSASLLATVWVILVIVGNVTSRADDTGMNLIGLLISFPTFLLFLPAQNYINSVNAAISPRPPYAKWSAGQYACLAIGIVLWVLIVAGLTLPEG